MEEGRVPGKWMENNNIANKGTLKLASTNYFSFCLFVCWLFFMYVFLLVKMKNFFGMLQN